MFPLKNLARKGLTCPHERPLMYQDERPGQEEWVMHIWQRKFISVIVIPADVLAPNDTCSSERTTLTVLLTHWGRVAHICVSKLTNIGSDNDLLSGWRQAIILINASMCWDTIPSELLFFSKMLNTSVCYIFSTINISYMILIV